MAPACHSSGFAKRKCVCERSERAQGERSSHPSDRLFHAKRRIAEDGCELQKVKVLCECRRPPQYAHAEVPLSSVASSRKRQSGMCTGRDKTSRHHRCIETQSPPEADPTRLSFSHTLSGTHRGIIPSTVSRATLIHLCRPLADIFDEHAELSGDRGLDFNRLLQDSYRFLPLPQLVIDRSERRIVLHVRRSRFDCSEPDRYDEVVPSTLYIRPEDAVVRGRAVHYLRPEQLLCRRELTVADECGDIEQA